MREIRTSGTCGGRAGDRPVYPMAWDVPPCRVRRRSGLSSRPAPLIRKWGGSVPPTVFSGLVEGDHLSRLLAVHGRGDLTADPLCCGAQGVVGVA